LLRHLLLRHILRLKCTQFDFGWGSAPDLRWGAYSAPPYPVAGLMGPTSKGREEREGKGTRGKGMRKGVEESWYPHFLDESYAPAGYKFTHTNGWYAQLDSSTQTIHSSVTSKVRDVHLVKFSAVSNAPINQCTRGFVRFKKSRFLPLVFRCVLWLNDTS